MARSIFALIGSFITTHCDSISHAYRLCVCVYLYVTDKSVHIFNIIAFDQSIPRNIFACGFFHFVNFRIGKQFSDTNGNNTRWHNKSHSKICTFLIWIQFDNYLRRMLATRKRNKNTLLYYFSQIQLVSWNILRK